MGEEHSRDDRIWLEVVKAAVRANSESKGSSEQNKDDDTVRFCIPIEPKWSLVDAEVESRGAEESGILRESGEGFFVRRNDVLIVRDDFLKSRAAEEEELIVKLDGRSGENVEEISRKTFMAVLGPYLQKVSERVEFEEPLSVGAAEKQENASPLGRGIDEAAFLGLLKKAGARLGQKLLASIVGSCFRLAFWTPIHVLLRSGMIIRKSHRNLVESLVEEEQAFTLCLCINNVSDLTPQDVFLTLSFFLDSVERPSAPFRVVRQDWRRIASAEISKISTKKYSNVASSHGGVIEGNSQGLEVVLFQEVMKSHDDIYSAGIGMAMAVDRFSPPELCMHHLLASGQDEALLSVVISQLSTSQVLRLLTYLSKWIKIYASHLANFPSPRYKKMPSMAQVVHWAAIVLECHLMKLILSSDFHSELLALQNTVHSLVTMGSRVSALVGITEHIMSKSLMPASNKRGEVASDYVIELLDLS